MDAELTAEDTAILKKINGGTFSWRRRYGAGEVQRACVCRVDLLSEHGTNTILDNNFDGQFCLHYHGSKTRISRRMHNEITRVRGMSHEGDLVKIPVKGQKQKGTAAARQCAFAIKISADALLNLLKIHTIKLRLKSFIFHSFRWTARTKRKYHVRISTRRTARVVH